MILAAGGDIGGTRCLLPVVDWLLKQGESVGLVEHGFVHNELPNIDSGPLYFLPDSIKEAKELICKGQVSLFFFSTSLKDAFALKIARFARRKGIPVVCVMDSWMGARIRLETDGKPALIPDIYAVMDKEAYQNAIHLNGLPMECLQITGQPALFQLAENWRNWKIQDKENIFKRFQFDSDRKLIVFVSEPVEADQGGGNCSPQYRGYTEKTVLCLLSSLLQPFHDCIQVGLLAHPRQSSKDLITFWAENRKDLDGRLICLPNGREAVLAADGVCGMASILLYEAWLIGKPLLSLQPNLKRKDLHILQNKPGVYHIIEEANAEKEVSAWLHEIFHGLQIASSGKELYRHSLAPERLGRLIISKARLASNK